MRKDSPYYYGKDVYIADDAHARLKKRVKKMKDQKIPGVHIHKLASELLVIQLDALDAEDEKAAHKSHSPKPKRKPLNAKSAPSPRRNSK